MSKGSRQNGSVTLGEGLALEVRQAGVVLVCVAAEGVSCSARGKGQVCAAGRGGAASTVCKASIGPELERTKGI